MPALVHFWGEWCGRCRMVCPILARVGTEPAGRLEVEKLNVDSASGVAARHRAMRIPRGAGGTVSAVCPSTATTRWCSRGDARGVEGERRPARARAVDARLRRGDADG